MASGSGSSGSGAAGASVTQNSQEPRGRAIVLCFDGTGYKFCDKVRRNAAIISTQIHH